MKTNRIIPQTYAGSRLGGRNVAAFTLMETVVALAIAAMVIASLVSGFLQSARQAECSVYMVAAESLASQGLEQTRAAKWDPTAIPPVDELVSSNFPVTFDVLDVPSSGTNLVYATNTTTITGISTNPPLRMIRVDCVWRFLNGGLLTNSVFTYRGPDQ